MKFWNVHGQRCWEHYDCKEYRAVIVIIRSARNVVQHMKDLFDKNLDYESESETDHENSAESENGKCLNTKIKEID